MFCTHYSPISVVEAMTTGLLKNYWNWTESPIALARYIRMNCEGLGDTVAFLMGGSRVQIDTSTCRSDMMTFTCRYDILSLLVHLGYLGYEDETSEVFIPNKEIRDVFKASTKTAEWGAHLKHMRLLNSS